MFSKEDILYLNKKKLELITNCPVCHGSKPFCQCSYDFRWEIRKASAHIPIVYRDFTIDKLTHPQLTKQKAVIQNYIQGIRHGKQPELLLSGGPGLAKSSVACCLLAEVLRMGKSAYYFPSLRAAMEAVAQEFKGNAEDPAYVAMKTADTIVIDGLGYGFIRERSNLTDCLLEQVGRRLLANKHVIFVSCVEMFRLQGAEAEIITLVHPTEVAFYGFNYVSEVLAVAEPEKAAQVQQCSGPGMMSPIAFSPSQAEKLQEAAIANEKLIAELKQQLKDAQKPRVTRKKPVTKKNSKKLGEKK